MIFRPVYAAAKNQETLYVSVPCRSVETVVPLQYESTVTGYLMFGQVLLEGEETREELWKKVEDQSYDVDHQALKEAFFRKRRIDREKIFRCRKDPGSLRQLSLSFQGSIAAENEPGAGDRAVCKPPYSE